MSQYYGKRNITEEERKERSERALRMHNEVVIDSETGLERRKFGGPQPRSGRPRIPRATEKIAERVGREGDAYFNRLDDIAKNHPNANSSIAAIRELLGVEKEELKRVEHEQQRLEKLQRDELILIALDFINKTGIIDSGFDVDGQVENDEDGGYPELSSSS